MSTSPPPNRSQPELWPRIPTELRRLGISAWLFIGVIVAAGIIFWMLGAISNLVTPFVIALVCAALFHPMVDRMEAWSIPRLAGSLVVVLFLLTMMAVVIWITAIGILNQSGEMLTQVRKGVDALSSWAESAELPAEVVQQFSEKAINELPRLASGVASSFTSSISGVFTVFMGIFSAVFLLFSLMYDWHGVVRWTSANLGVPRPLGETLVADATEAIREYFKALTVSSLLISFCIGGTMAALGLPLPIQVGLVTMITSYVPYVGALVAGLFAVLVAMGAGGFQAALIVLAMVLLLQNVLQTIIQNRMASERLHLHPIITFTSVIAGGVLFGVLGAALANPVVAMILTARRRFIEYRESTTAKPDSPR